MIARRSTEYHAFRIAPGDTNRLALVFDPIRDRAGFVCAVEIFDVGGRTPPNVHHRAQEMFFVLKGEGVCHCAGNAVALRQGDSLMLPPGETHEIENTGPGRLYCLTVMVPDEDFAALIRGGTPAALDEEDLAVIAGVAPRQGDT